MSSRAEEQAAFDRGEPHAIPADYVQTEIERFGRLIVVELRRIRVDATAAEIAKAVDNAVRRFKFEPPAEDVQPTDMA